MKMDMPLLPLVQKYFEQDPVSATHTLETIGVDEAAEILGHLPVSLAVEAFRHLNDAYAAVLLQKLPHSFFRRIANHLDTQQSANILLQFSDDKRQEFIAVLEDNKKRDIQDLLRYPEGSAGRIMSVDFIAFHGDVKIKSAILKIRQLAQQGATTSYIYVIDQEGHLVGIMNMRDMLLAENDDCLESVMRRDIFAVHCFDNIADIANELSSRKYFAVPVIDHENRMLGVVRADRLINEIKEDATESIQRMFGGSGDERAFAPLHVSMKTRLPWLHINLATAFLAAWVVSLFEGLIAKITVLAVYLPVVAGQGGNAGAQSLAVVMRGIVMREIPPHKAKQLILKETALGLLNGIIIGLVTGVIAWLWQGNPFLGVVIGLGMVVNLTFAGLSGAAIPLVMKALRFDPAQCSNIILTTVTDVMGFVAFLGFAVVFQNFLVMH